MVPESGPPESPTGSKRRLIFLAALGVLWVFVLILWYVSGRSTVGESPAESSTAPEPTSPNIIEEYLPAAWDGDCSEIIERMKKDSRRPPLPPEVPALLSKLHGIADEERAELVALLAEKAVIPSDAIESFLEVLRERSIPANSHFGLFEDFVMFFDTLKGRIEEAREDMTEIGDALTAVESLLDAGYWDDAESVVTGMESDILERVESSPDLAAELVPQAARLRTIRGRILQLQLEFGQAAEHFLEAARFVYPYDDARHLGYRLSAAYALHYRTALERDPSHLMDAIELYREALASHTHELDRNELADTRVNLGVALAGFAELNGDMQLFEESVEEYLAALEILTWEEAPHSWITAQYYLARSLGFLGMHMRDSEKLRRASEAYQLALHDCYREFAPLKWANTVCYLARTLDAMNRLGPGTDHLEAALMLLRTAAEEVPRELAPYHWARVQRHTGFVLSRIGYKENNAARLEAAIVAYQNALEEYTRDDAPSSWAEVMNSKGAALAHLGELTEDPIHLEAAIVTFLETSDVYDRESEPLKWATVHHNIGSAHRKIERIEGSTGRLEQAVAAYREALKERTLEQTPHEWAGTQNLLGLTLWSLAIHESGTERLEEAVVAYREALKVRRREEHPSDWALTTWNLANALMVLGEREGGTTRLKEAAAAFEEVAEVLQAEDYETRAAHAVEARKLILKLVEFRESQEQ